MKNPFEQVFRHSYAAFCLCTVLSLFLLTSCENGAPSSNKTARVVMGNVKLGGVFHMNIPEETRSIFPHNIVDASSTNIMNQVYEGLMRLDPVTNKTEPALAESYTVSEDAKTYTFYLRKGVYFHDDQAFKNGKGREVRADDIVFCFTKLCEPSPHNQLYSFLIDVIKGARQHYDSGSTDPIEGLKAIDDYTVQFTLDYPASTFLSILTHPCGWIFPRELFEYKNDIDSWCIGTGPFVARTVKMNEVVILERNQNYWRRDEYGNQLPYIDAVRCSFISNEKRQMDLFLKGNLDLLLEVPYSNVERLRAEAIEKPESVIYKILTAPGLRVEYYAFQNRGDLFKDERVRKALNYSIDRNLLVDSLLHGYGEPAIHGFIPPAMPGYPIDSVKGYTYQPELARTLFAEAGFPDGEGFPVLALQINDGSTTVINVAAAVQKMLTECLNITVEISVLPRNRHYEEVENGGVNFWRDGWIGDYANPENFLRLFDGDLVPDDSVKASYLNTVRFKDDLFDSYYEKSLAELDPDKRMSDYWHADQELMDRAAVAPLYYEKWIWLVNKKIRNLDMSGIGILDLSKVYFDKRTTDSGLSNAS